MTNIKPKLYLNMSPQTQEEGSLAFARNVKIDNDGNLVSDYGYEDIADMSNHNVVGHIVGLDNKLYFFCEDEIEEETHSVNYRIIEYDEITKRITVLNTGWVYYGGKITGCVNTNQSGEVILTVCEYDAPNNRNIPLRHINLSHCNENDNVSIYTQAPEVPIANLKFEGTYNKTIPNGVYVFFIRYKIRKDVYTNWFLCSRPIFGGTSEKISTFQGGLKYINAHRDSAKSFIFNIEFLNTGTNNVILQRFSEFQLGFVITHNEATDARIWKSFPTNIDTSNDKIYFDYEDVKETNIDDMLASTYEIYNVKNITSFKNKLYISNYVETNFNPQLSQIEGLSLTANVVNGTYNHARQLRYKNNTHNWNQTYNYFPLQEINSDDYIVDFTTLSKKNVTEKECASFDVKWKFEIAQVKPELAVVYNISNNLIGDGTRVFGDDFKQPFWVDDNTKSALKTVNVQQVTGESDKYIVTNNNSNTHPWKNLGFTYVYGSLKNTISGNFNSSTEVSFLKENSYSIDAYQSREFTDAARIAIDTNIKKEIESLYIFSRCYIEFFYGTKSYKYNYNIQSTHEEYIGYYDENTGTDREYQESIDDVGGDLSNSTKNEIITTIFNALGQEIKGVDENGTMVIEHTEGNNTYTFKATSAVIHFKKYQFKCDIDNVVNDEHNIHKQVKVTLKTTNYVSVATFVPKQGTFTFVDNLQNTTQKCTLMPLTKYQPYIHFVDKHGIITNGIKLTKIVNNQKVDDIIDTTNIIPKADDGYIQLKYNITSDFITSFSNVYKAFFISLENIGDIIINCFGYIKQGNTHIIQCLEADALLYNLNDKITVLGYEYNNSQLTIDTITTEANYYSSGSAYPPLAFGNCGYIAWENNTNYNYTKYFVKISRDKKQESQSLVKSTPYIDIKVANKSIDDNDLFTGSYLCSVKKPDILLSSDSYVAGNDVYSATRTSYVKLTNFEGYIQSQNSVTYNVLSNFNLNYLSLTEDIADKIFSIGSSGSGVKQIAKVINSATLSYIYELKSMYKDFMNKKFAPFEEDNKIQFDNTIRVSNTLSDETFNNSVFKFEATNYYNIPTDRGIIVNLFAIGNIIFAHCKQSLFKFDGNQTIMSSDTDITLKESEPFDAGISQVFDSQYGYGGIDNKESGCITFDSYLFYDRFSNHVFAYSGNGQVQIIDGSIYKLLSYYKPDKCYTIHDDSNNRVLFDFRVDDSKRFCLSYNYKAKSFVSFHDLNLIKAFNSKKKCYSYYNNLCDLFESDTINTEVLTEALNTIKLYGPASINCSIMFGVNEYKIQTTPFGIAVVFFTRETPREVLDTVKFIANIIKDKISLETVSNVSFDLVCNPEITKYTEGKPVNPIDSFYIITDSCVSNLITGTVDDTNRPGTVPSIPNGLLDYKAIKFDIDSWNINYFRNILHADNVYDYQYGDESTAAANRRSAQVPFADNNSLVYGRYFILNFNFIKESPIKFEEISITTNAY